MANLRSSSKGLRSSSSSNSRRLNSTARPSCSLPVPKSRKIYKRTSKEFQDYIRPYATDAISFYNNQTEGAKYELVKPGEYANVRRGTYVLYHIDFTAKKIDVADAPEEMFFAELTTTNNVRSVKCCKCMGPKKSISGDKNNGCCYCRFYNVQHPRDGGFMAGRAGLFTDGKKYYSFD